MPVRPILRLRLLAPAFIGLLPLSAPAFLHATTEFDSGPALYVEHCAACHGVDLEGQPDWRSPYAEGRCAAPPYVDTGHTWHRDDAELID